MLRSHSDQTEPVNHAPSDGAKRAAAARKHDASGRSLGRQSQKVLADVKELGAIAIESVGDTVTRLKDRGRGAVADGRRRAQMAKSGFESLVADHPVKSLLIAVGVGAILAMTLRRRKAPVEMARE